MSKILVLGGGGMLGHKLCQCLRNHEVIATVRKDAGFYDAYPEVFRDVKLIGGVDVLDYALLERTIRGVRPDAVVNCIGIIKQLEQAHDAFLSVAVNSYLPHWLAGLCGRIGSRLVHISTDCVFDGSKGGYHEDDFSDARDLYGKSKFLGETTSSETSAVTLRTSIIGRELSRPAHGLLEWFLAQRGKSIRGFAKAVFSGFTTLELSRVIATVIEEHRGLCGVWHVASEPINKYNLLVLLKESLGLDVQIEPDEQFVCDRSLCMERFAKETGYTAPSWDMMVRQLKNDTTPYDNYTAGG